MPHAPTPSSEPASTPARIRVVTAASLFDGHDAAINIMRRLLQQMGAEVIHLGHNRAVADIVKAGIEEDRAELDLGGVERAPAVPSAVRASDENCEARAFPGASAASDEKCEPAAVPMH